MWCGRIRADHRRGAERQVIGEEVVGRRAAGVSVRALAEDPSLSITLEVVGGATGMDRIVRAPRIQKSGLALAGHDYGIEPTRVQILGMTEMTYLRSLSKPKCQASVQRFFDRDLCCVVVTNSALAMPSPHDDVSAAVIAAANEVETPLLTATQKSSHTILALHALLDERLAPRARVHGVLVDVFEVGLLMLGASGVGKSEVALELIMRGHRLVADDVVECHFRAPGMVFGSPADLLRHHLEVRGLGILNIKDLFGVTAVRGRKRVDVIVVLVEREVEHPPDRLGLEERYHKILGVEIQELLIQVRPGRDIASILEIAARNELLKQAGLHPAREFFGRLEGALMGGDSEVPTPIMRPRTPVPGAPRLADLTPAAPESSVGQFTPPGKK